MGNDKEVAVTSGMKNAVFQAISLIPAVSCLIGAVPFALFHLRIRSSIFETEQRKHFAKEPCFLIRLIFSITSIKIP